MLKEALKYPRKSDNIYRTFAIGGLLNFFKFLLFPMFFLNGYLSRVLGTTVDKAKKPPRFERPEELFVDGLKYSLIIMVYMLVPALFMAFGRGGMAGMTEYLLAPWGVLTLLVTAAVVYLVPVALTNSAREKALRKGFDFEEIKKVALTTDYLSAFLTSALIYLLGGFASLVLVVLLTLSVVGIFVVPVAPSFVMFYTSVAGHRVLGEGFRRAL